MTIVEFPQQLKSCRLVRSSWTNYGRSQANADWRSPNASGAGSIHSCKSSSGRDQHCLTAAPTPPLHIVVRAWAPSGSRSVEVRGQDAVVFLALAVAGGRGLSVLGDDAIHRQFDTSCRRLKRAGLQIVRCRRLTVDDWAVQVILTTAIEFVHINGTPCPWV